MVSLTNDPKSPSVCVEKLMPHLSNKLAKDLDVIDAFGGKGEITAAFRLFPSLFVGHVSRHVFKCASLWKKVLMIFHSMMQSVINVVCLCMIVLRCHSQVDREHGMSIHALCHRVNH